MKTSDTLDESLIKRTKPVSLLLLAVIPLLLGPLLGVVTNFINAAVSEEYFEIVMGWDLDYISISTLAMLQGALEGFIYGAIFSFVFTIYVTRAKRKNLGSSFFRSVFVRAIVVILMCWLLGGVLGIVLFRQFPELASDLIRGKLYRFTYELERYGWVAGSIWGGMVGGVLALGWAIWRTFREKVGSIAP